MKTAAAATTNSYDYDVAGNRTQETIAGAQTTFVYNNSVNKLTSRSGAQGSATFTHDLNGSLIADGTRTFEWDGANRLVAINIGTHRSEFSYDGIGRRTRIVEKDNSVVTSDKRYVWCGGEICEERDSTGSVVQKRFYEQGIQDNGVKIHYTRDHLGSIREKTDTGNQVTARYDYDQWGRQTVLAGSKDTFGYAGYFVHSPSGLLLTWYRAYDPNLGRWISRDPIEERGGVNLYAYVENSPVYSIDPEGLGKVQVCCRGLAFLKPLLTVFHHCYIRIEGDNGKIHTYGILGNPGSRKNQIPRHGNGTTEDDGGRDRNTGGEKSCKDVNGNDCQIDKLKEGLDAAVASGTCPSCGTNYREWIPTDLLNFFDGFNSNTWVYNMVSGAGMVPPRQSRAPGYHKVPGKWYP